LNIRNTTAKLAALTALPLAFCATAHAQSADFTRLSHLSYNTSYSTSHETWHTVLLISGVLLLAGLIDDSSGLIILGGAGVLIAESETNGTAFRQTMGHGMEFAKLGKVSFGFNPFGQSFAQGLQPPRPNLVIQTKLKF
jgi:hypothetical protein